MKNADPHSTIGDKDRLKALYEAVQAFRQHDPEITSQAISVLLLIATRPGITMLEVGGQVDLSNTASSRNIHKFRNKGDGLGLIRQEEDPADGRRKLLFLTA